MTQVLAVVYPTGKGGENMLDYTNMSLKDIVALPGVKDLPLIVRGKFGQALKAEAEGRYEDASKLLDAAIEKEAQG